MDLGDGVIRLFIVEEQRIFNALYKEVFSTANGISVVGIVNNTNLGDLRSEIVLGRPDVLFVGVKVLNGDVIHELEEIRNVLSNLGLVVCINSHGPQSANDLKGLARRVKSGLALLCKQSVDRAEQLCSTIKSVHEGQVILDPMVTDSMFGENERGPISELTVRERQVIDLISRGRTNAAIADILFIDQRTVQHHINNIYNKLKDSADFNTGHPRVTAARLYLETTGQLQTIGVADRGN